MGIVRGLKRHWKWFWQRRFRGFDDRELWNLDVTIAEFILPRLKAFKAYTHGYPSGDSTQEIDNDSQGMKDWHAKLDKMIESFETIAGSDYITHDRYNEVKEGLDFFVRYYQHLWD